MLLLLWATNAIAQESNNLILKFWGYNDDPYKINFVNSNLSEGTSNEDIQKIIDFYIQHEEEILSRFDLESHLIYVQKATKETEQKAIQIQNSSNAITNAVMGMIEQNRQEKVLKEQEKAIKKEEQWERLQATTAANKQKYAEFQTMTNKKASTSSNSYQSRSTSQGSYNDLLTSDPNWNKQVQMWVQQYGVEKTREIVNQKRASDYQQSVQSSHSNSYNQSMSDRIISAATSSRQQLKIKVRGNSVIAYSNGIDQLGRQEWTPVLPGAGISRTGAGSLYSTGDLSKEFSYTANINGTQIYFDM